MLLRGRRVGVAFRLDASLSLEFKPRDAELCARRRRLERSGVEESILAGVAVRESRFSPPTTLIVGVERLGDSCFTRLGECASMHIGSGTPDLTHGLTV